MILYKDNGVIWLKCFNFVVLAFRKGLVLLRVWKFAIVVADNTKFPAWGYTLKGVDKSLCIGRIRVSVRVRNLTPKEFLDYK